MSANPSDFLAYWIIGSILLVVAAFAAITLWKIIAKRK